MTATPEDLENDHNYLLRILEKTRQKLLDQTRRNRLLNHKETARDIAIIDEMADLVFEDLVLNGGSFYFDHLEKDEKSSKEPDLFTETAPDRTLPRTNGSRQNLEQRYSDDKLQTPLSEKELERRLRRLYQEHRSLIEETGANSLFVAMGFLEWSDTEEEPRPMRSPLMLVPVRLEREGTAGQAKYSLRFDDEALDSNYSLIEKLKREFDINFPLLVEEEKPEAYWVRVNQAIIRRKPAGWKVVHEMSLGLFRFNKQVMWHDLDPTRWPEHAPIVDKKVLKRILLGPKEGEPEPGQIRDEYPQDGEMVDPSLPQIKLIRDADSSQYSSLIDSLTCDGGLVIEGPPGTGKSQTITNLIAAALGNGMSVLFIAEKMAALEVVYKRLEENGLGPFCLQLHGLKTSKKELLASVAQRIDYRASSPDNLIQKEKQLLQARNELIAYSKILSERVGPEELPLYDLPWRVERLRQELPDEIDEIDFAVAGDISYEQFIALKNQLNDLGSEWSAIPDDARNAWAGYLPTNYNEKNAQVIKNANESIISALKSIGGFLYETNTQGKAPMLFEAGRLLELVKTPPEQTVKVIPIGLDSRIIYRVVLNNVLEDYQSLLNDIGEYLKVVGKVNETFDYSDKQSEHYAHLLQLHSKKLANIALASSVSVNELKGQVEEFNRCINCLESLSVDSVYVTDILNRVARNVDDYTQIAKEAADLVGGPVELSLHGNTNHAKSSIKNYLEQAKLKYANLQKRSEELSVFVVSRVKDSDEIDEIKRIIEGKTGSFFAIFNSDYRKAKKRVKQILASPKGFEKSEIFIDKLALLYALCKEIEEYGNSADFKAVLGGLFVGMATDWKKLDALVSFSQSLREKVGIDNASMVLSDWDAHVDKTSELKDRVSRSLETISKFNHSHPFPETMWQRPVVEIANTLRPWSEKIQAANDSLCQPWCRSTTTLEQAQQATVLYKKANERESAIEILPGFSLILNSQWGRSATDYQKLNKINEWIVDSLTKPGMHINILMWAFVSEDELDTERYTKLHAKIAPFSEAWRTGLGVLNQQGEVNESLWMGGKTQDIEGLDDKLQGANDTIASLPLMKRWAHTSESVAKKGFGIIADRVMENVLRGDQCGKAYEYCLYKSIYDQKISVNETLAEFSETRYQNTRDRFAELDREIMNINAKQIAAKLTSVPVPTGIGSGPTGGYTNKRLLVHEANKKSRHIPIRQLIKRSSKALKALKPCFLMSPISVAQYLAPGDINFDLVVMDEASQLRPEDALGAIARADKSIIVGDPKQLPPASFFDTSASDDDDEEEATVIDDTEAILDVCLKQFPYRRLRWHYRSQHESLIQFSNEQFYDGDLIVFPSPKREVREYGVHYNYIDNPSYKKGRNRREAEVVVENIIHHFYRHAKKSLGVAVFNKAQAEEISLLLDKARQKDPAVDELISGQEHEEPLFIKNLENVQGDERDVIFISTTYGPEQAGGPVAQRFGPINSDLGWRRLNVIATRAKQRVEVFTSMRPTDINISENARRGVRSLRDYLDYAYSGKVPERGIATGKAPDSAFEVAVMRLITNLGYQCDPQVGVAGFYIDIGVRNPDRPGEYVLGIECDGATYHSSVSVRDRDRLRQEILERKGWFIHRIWSTNWFRARSTEIDRLKRVIEAKLEEDRKTYTVIADYEETPEIVTQAAFATEEEIKQEIQEESLLLEEALERFWQQNIQPLYSERNRSILSEAMIKILVKTRPTNKDEWFTKIPTEIRQSVRPDEGEFRQDIFDIISEYE